MALSNAAVIPSSNPDDQGDARTLGLATVAAGAIGSGIGTIGRLAATAIGVLAAAKPLIMLGLGKCKYE